MIVDDQSVQNHCNLFLKSIPKAISFRINKIAFVYIKALTISAII